jgi:trehalose 6-phosphate phosphatase
MPNVPPLLPPDLTRLAVLLDVDGTILDMASSPLEVSVPQTLRDTLERLWERTGGALAFVSGRPIGQLDFIFSPLVLPSIGGHGAELRTKAGTLPNAARLPPLEAEARRRFAEIAQASPDVLLEDKGYSLALHYRAAPALERMVHERAAAVCASLAGLPLELLPGKLVVEIKQRGFTKGTAVRELMTYAPFAGRRPIFIGDDITDLGVFEILPRYDGIGISVGRDVPGIRHSFERPADVRRWLEQISKSGAFATS